MRPYDPTGARGPRNGGIVGTVTYDTTRNELDARYSAVEPWSPGIPNIPVNLYQPVFCGTNPNTPCDAGGLYELAADGSYAKGLLINAALTEQWEQPTDCIARGPNGDPLPYGSPNPEVLPLDAAGKRCIEAPLMGTQFQSQGFATLDGNYGFGDGCLVSGFNPAALADPNAAVCNDPNEEPALLPADDYLVEVAIPNDALGRPLYKVAREEDINVFGGDQFAPQVPPPACAGALHVVDVAGMGADGPDAVVNPSFVDAGGSPYEGMQRPLCDVKLVTLANGKSIAPTFNFFTDVPIPGKWKGYIIDDLTVSTDPRSINLGEKAGIPNMPIGIYDFANRLVTTIQSDPNGVFEVLLPSTYSINCPTPSGVCPNVYYMLGNDPGQPGRLNPNYNPQYRTIGASFEIYPGLIIPSDLAPTQIVPGVLAGGSQFQSPPQCALNNPAAPNTPELFAVSRPYHDVRQGVGTLTIRGQGFGAAAGQVTLDDTTLLPITAWSDTQITVGIPTTTPAGARQLKVRSASGKTTVNGLTFHVLSGTYNAQVFEVGPGKTYAAIQAGIDAAAAANGSRPRLVVVYPGATAQWNPTGTYYENLILYSPVALQGVGPGGVYANGQAALGSVVDGRGVGGDTDYAAAWRSQVLSLNWSGNQAVYEGAVITVLAEDGELTSTRSIQIDGLTIEGGDQQGFPNQLAPIDPTIKDIAAIQGGGVYANAYARYLKITNNVLRSNGGAYGGAIRLGTPHLTGAFNDNQNDSVRIANNRILANGGTNLAGAIGIFSGSEGYDVAYNDICGNFSAEYGGGVSHYGYSPNGRIHHNRIYFNRAYDEGGGVMVAGELPANPALLSPGAGPVEVYANLVEGNLSNDDGGGLRFLMAGNFPYNVYNNIIASNVSTHEGGGVSLNDAPNVRFYNNTVMNNITTATAVTSMGQPAPAGLATSRNSALLQATLPADAAPFSNPLLFNNIFWDNRAGRFTGATVAGIGLAGDPNPVETWDMGVSDDSGVLAPTTTLMQTTRGTVTDAGNTVGANPQVVQEYATSVTVQPWRGNPRFVDILMVTVDAIANSLGDYRLASGSPAANRGASARGAIQAPAVDFEGNLRPSDGGYELGADEIAGAVSAFPLTPVLDNFNRANNNSVGPNWGGQPGNFRVNSNNAQLRTIGISAMHWLPASFGSNQEAFMTIVQYTALTSEQALVLKLTNGNANQSRASLIEVLHNPISNRVDVWTHTQAQGWVLQARFTGVSMASGDQLGARALANGVVTVYKNGVMLGSVNVTAGPRPWPAALAAGGGQIGVYYNYIGLLTSPRFDNLGGGTLPGSVMAADEGASGQTEIFYGDAPAGLGEVDNSKQMQEGYEAEYLFLPAISSQ